MFRTAIVRASAKTSKNGGGGIKSLALSVHFKQPDFGMKEYEILSRATTFLLAVDPPDDDNDSPSSKYSFLDDNIQARKAKELQQQYAHPPAGGPRRNVEDLGWLEFCPQTFRPIVHCVAASHVLAPWKWSNYYTQPWLQQVKPEHCVYSLEVYSSTSPYEALAKFALNPYPIHHPDGRDLALIHLKQEEEALEQLKKLGVDILHCRDENLPFSKGQDVTFDGFVVTEENTTDHDQYESAQPLNSSSDDDDTRIFLPYTETGSLLVGNKDRFLATTTPNPLPEGLCGGPALDADGNVCGVVEGVMPQDYPDSDLAGAASFLPTPILSDFVDYAEQVMLKEIFPDKMFEMVVDYKKGLGKEQVEYNVHESEKKETQAMQSKLSTAFEERMESLKKHHSMEEVNAILTTIRRERDEVMDIWNRQGGDLDEIIAQVRSKTRRIQQELFAGLSKQEQEEVAQKLGRPPLDAAARVKEAEFEEKKEG